MKNLIMAAAFLCGAFFIVQDAAAAKKVLKHFTSKAGYMVFYVDGTWQSTAKGKTQTGTWKWIDARHVCPVEWTGAKQKKHCKTYYKAK